MNRCGCTNKLLRRSVVEASAAASALASSALAAMDGKRLPLLLADAAAAAVDFTIESYNWFNGQYI